MKSRKYYKSSVDKVSLDRMGLNYSHKVDINSQISVMMIDNCLLEAFQLKKMSKNIFKIKQFENRFSDIINGKF